MVALRVIGVDPGPTTGLALICWHADSRVPTVEVAQVSDTLAVELFGLMLGAPTDHNLVAIERFVVGRTSMKSGRDGEVTRTLIGAVSERATRHGDTPVLRSAANVKPWATDERLAAAGLLDVCKAMGHARDAARHALFTAVRDGGLPDPLSTRSNR